MAILSLQRFYQVSVGAEHIRHLVRVAPQNGRAVVDLDTKFAKRYSL